MWGRQVLRAGRARSWRQLLRIQEPRGRPSSKSGWWGSRTRAGRRCCGCRRPGRPRRGAFRAAARASPRATSHSRPAGGAAAALRAERPSTQHGRHPPPRAQEHTRTSRVHKNTRQAPPTSTPRDRGQTQRWPPNFAAVLGAQGRTANVWVNVAGRPRVHFPLNVLVALGLARPCAIITAILLARAFVLRSAAPPTHIVLALLHHHPRHRGRVGRPAAAARGPAFGRGR